MFRIFILSLIMFLGAGSVLPAQVERFPHPRVLDGADPGFGLALDAAFATGDEELARVRSALAVVVTSSVFVQGNTLLNRQPDWATFVTSDAPGTVEMTARDCREGLRTANDVVNELCCIYGNLSWGGRFHGAIMGPERQPIILATTATYLDLLRRYDELLALVARYRMYRRFCLGASLRSGASETDHPLNPFGDAEVTNAYPAMPQLARRCWSSVELQARLALGGESLPDGAASETGWTRVPLDGEDRVFLDGLAPGGLSDLDARLVLVEEAMAAIHEFHLQATGRVQDFGELDFPADRAGAFHLAAARAGEILTGMMEADADLVRAMFLVGSGLYEISGETALAVFRAKERFERIAGTLGAGLRLRLDEAPRNALSSVLFASASRGAARELFAAGLGRSMEDSGLLPGGVERVWSDVNALVRLNGSPVLHVAGFACMAEYWTRDGDLLRNADMATLLATYALSLELSVCGEEQLRDLANTLFDDPSTFMEAIEIETGNPLVFVNGNES